MRLCHHLKAHILTAVLVVACVQLFRLTYLLLRDEPSLVVVRDSWPSSSVDEAFAPSRLGVVDASTSSAPADLDRTGTNRSRDVFAISARRVSDKAVVVDVLLKSTSTKNVDEEVEDWIAVNTSHPIVNPHPFNFTINCPHMCDGDDVFLLNYVHTSTDHFEQRRRIRGTWANASNYPEVRMKTIFVVGTSSAASLLWWKTALIAESQKYGDIVQENFFDSYR